jgi:hypothetical protein
VVVPGSGTDQAVYEQLPADKQPWDNIKRLDRLDPTNANDQKNIGLLDVALGSDAGIEAKLPAYVYAGNVYTGDNGDPRDAGDLLTITLKNGYPGYQEYVTAAIKNVGNIPVKFEINPDLTADDQNTMARKTDVGIAKWLQVKIVDADNNSIVYFDSTNTDPSKLEGKKLDPGDKPIRVKIITRVLDDPDKSGANQSTTTSFTLQLRAIEWNEYGFTVLDKIL